MTATSPLPGHQAAAPPPPRGSLRGPTKDKVRTPSTPVTLLDAALHLADAGLSVVPTRPDGTKAPAAFWKQFQQRTPTPDELHTWLEGGGFDGIGAVTGTVSGNLEMLELEGRAMEHLAGLAELADNSGLGDLWRTVTTGYLETTPSGGLHLLYRVAGGPHAVAGNTKLARRPATDEELAAKPEEKTKVLVETRGEGGYVVLAPSAGRTHPTGRPWTLLTGGPGTIPTITPEQRDALHGLVRTLDQLPEPLPVEPPPSSRPRAARPDGRQSPGDDYNRRAAWADILGPLGWQLVHRSGTTCYWRRPGKTIGVSATTGRNDGDNLYVFSTSTEFEAETAYSKFAAHALLSHGGDFSKAARSLAGAGFGDPVPEPDRDVAGLIAPAAAQPSAPAAASAPDAPSPPDPPAVQVVAPGPSTYTRTDDGNALRLVDTQRHLVRYCPDRGQWLAWNGHRWRWDIAGAVNELARDIARNLPQEEKVDERHRALTLSARGLAAMVAIARTDARIVAPVDTLDAKPYELNTPAGIIDLRTAQLRTPDPAALHTRSTNVAPDSATTPHRWLTFLADTFAGDPALTTYVQRLLGVSLIGQVLEQVLPFGYGEGANGKTTMLGVVQRVIGLGDDGYSISAPAELRLATANQGHPTEIARLAGARLVVTSELDEGQRFAEAKVKKLTGRDAVSGRFMRQDWFSFTPTHTLWMLANHQPAVRSGGPAFWRRLRLVPFLHTVPPEQRDPHLEDQLVEQEGPAILGWLIAGARDYLAQGLDEPAAVRVATDAYERDQDTVSRFVDELAQTGDPNAQHMVVRVTELRTAYEKWCSQEGEQPVSQKALTLALRSRYGVLSDRSMHARFYRGIRLTDPSSAPGDASEGSGSEEEGWWQR